jgi:hypothetical protein
MSLITITQSMGCPGERIAKLVADSLDLELYDDARLQSTVQTMGREFEDLKHFRSTLYPCRGARQGGSSRPRSDGKR